MQTVVPQFGPPFKSPRNSKLNVLRFATLHKNFDRYAKTVIVSKGNDSADFEIVKLIGKKILL